jgi:hypothetical protein
MGQQFAVQFDQFGSGDDGGVSWCIVMVEEQFFLPNGAIFSAIRCWCGPIIRHSRTLWPGNGGHHLSGWYNSLCLLQITLAGWSPLFWMFLGLWCVPVDPCFIDGHETTQKLLRIALKQHQTLLWWSHSCTCPKWANTALIMPKTFSFTKFHAGCVSCILFQLSRALSIGFLSTWDRGFLSCYLTW